jgi:hypothetical protein
MAAPNVYYSAEFVVSFEKLKKGVVESQATLEKLEKELNEIGKKAGKDAFGKLGDEAEKAKEKIKKQMAETRASLAKLSGEIKKSGDKTGKELFEKPGKEAGTFFSAFKKGWKDATDVAGGEAVKLGKFIGSIISPMYLAITAATAAFAFIATKAREAYNNWKEHNKNVLIAKGLYDKLSEALSGTAKREAALHEAEKGVREERELAWQAQARIERDAEANANEASRRALAQGKSYEEAVVIYEEALKKEIADREAVFALEKDMFDAETERMIQRAKARADEQYGAKVAADALIAQRQALAEYNKDIDIYNAKNNRNLYNELELIDAKIAAERGYIDALIVEGSKLKTSTELERQRKVELDYEINAHNDLLKGYEAEKAVIEDRNGESVKELTLQEKLDNARAAAAERYRETVSRVNADLEAGILTDKEAEAARTGAMASWMNALQGIVDEYNLTSGYTVDLLKEKRAIVGETEKQTRLEKASRQLAEDTVEIHEQIKKQVIDRTRAVAEIADTEEEKNRLLDEAIRLETDLLDAQREREKQAYKESDAYKLMLAEDKNAADEWETAFNNATEGMKKSLIELKKDLEEGFDFEGLAANISQGLGYFESAASSVLSITQSMADDQITVIENLLEEQRELIDAEYEAAMKRLEDERQAALEAAGFVKTVTEEGLEAAMEAAVNSGDEAVIYREERRQKELAINKQYDKLEADAEKKKNDDLKDAEKNASRDIADINYRQAMADWTIKLAMAPAQIASAILEGYAQAGPFGGIAGAIIMSVVGALQTAALIAAMPKKPSFAGGGVVGLPQTYSGGYADGGIVMSNTPRGVDAVDATLADREMVLNDRHQADLFKAITSGQFGGGEITIIVQTVLDG